MQQLIRNPSFLAFMLVIGRLFRCLLFFEWHFVITDCLNDANSTNAQNLIKRAYLIMVLKLFLK